MEAVRASLRTRIVGKHLVYLSTAGSTNDHAARLAQTGCAEGTAVFAEYQTAGRGRLGRQWCAPARSSVLLSVVLRPRLPNGQVQQITMIAALAVADAIQECAGLAVDFKWPNDVLLAGGKLAGILCESTTSSSGLDYVVVGLGLNVNADPAALSEGLLMRATSLSSQLGRPVAREPLLVALLEALDRRYLALRAGQPFVAEWSERLLLLGETVEVCLAGSVVRGMAEGVDEGGALLVRTPSGALVRVMAGDVRPLPDQDWREPHASVTMDDTDTRAAKGPGTRGHE